MRIKSRVAVYIGVYLILFCLIKVLDANSVAVSNHPILAIVVVLLVLTTLCGLYFLEI